MGFLDLCLGYRIFEPKETDRALALDIAIRPGRVVKGSLVGPNAKPVAGATAFGLNFDPVMTRDVMYSKARENEVLKAHTFAATSLDPQQGRTLSFIHKERKLIGHVVLEGNEEGPVQVRMQPWGVLTGRLVGASGKPLSGIRITLHYPRLPSPGVRPPDESAVTDAAGRFRIEGLLPGLKHELALKKEKATLSAGEALKGLSARSGEVKDLGDVRVTITPAAGNR
jgi:hypothetical protein